MIQEIKSIAVTCKACGTSVTVIVPGSAEDYDKARLITNGIKTAVCPICKNRYEFSLDELVQDAERLNAAATKLQAAASSHGVEYQRGEVNASKLDPFF